jgi:hypothetical protein
VERLLRNPAGGAPTPELRGRRISIAQHSRGCGQARSREAELAIDAAKKLQLEEKPTAEQVAQVSERLKRYLGSEDKFWPRWLYFAEEHGVSI